MINQGVYNGIFRRLCFYASFICSSRFHMDYLIYAALLHSKFRASTKRIGRDQFFDNLWVDFLCLLRVRPLLVWGTSGCWFKLCTSGYIIGRVSRFLSLRNLWPDQLYFLQGISAFHNPSGHHLGFSLGRSCVFVRLFNFSAFFLPKLEYQLFVPENRFSRSCA